MSPAQQSGQVDSNGRILVIDDNRAIHADFRKILTIQTGQNNYEDLSAEIFGESAEQGQATFEIDSAYQGQEGLERVRQALAEGRPYALAFVDVRMPPGWDGIETIGRIWEVDPEIQLVICTAYADHSWEEITSRVGGSDKLVVLKKPFDVIEVLQLAHALTRKWALAQASKRQVRELDQKIDQRTRELGESEARYRSLFENMLEGFAYCRVIYQDDRPVDLVYLEVNKAFEKQTGLKDVVGRRLSEVLPGLMESHPGLIERYARVAATGEADRFELYLEPLHAWLAISAYSPARDHFIAVFDNITVRKEAELRLAAFARLNQQLGAAKSTKEAARIIVDTADQLIGWDACICDLYSSTENIVSHVLSVDLIDGQRTECEPGPINFQAPSELAQRAIAEGGQFVLRQAQDAPVQGSVPFGDTSRPSASILYVPIRNAQTVTGILSIQSYRTNAYTLRDLDILQTLADRCSGAMERIRTEESLHKAQEQLRHSQKLEGIGQLAGGVAHDFNNLLSVIRGNVEIVLMEPDRLTGEDLGCLKEVVGAAERAADLTRQLLAFSRKQVMQFRPLNLNDVIANLSKMLKRLIGEQIQLQCSYSADLPSVRADVGMIEQVLVNLVVNARDAMGRGGQVVVATKTVSLDRAYAHSHSEARAGQFVCFSVTDTGTGIAPEHLSSIFEPFFTTKELGKGTGLGLSTVYGIVKQHSGWVEVASKLGAGSTFEVFLPAVEMPRPEPAVADPAATAPPRGGRETILLVEDEQAVRTVTRRFLARAGYSVVEAVSGRQALEIWRKRGQDFDLVLTDMVMPDGVSGSELAEQLWSEAPDLKVIFTSGYSPSSAGKEADFLRPGQSRFLQKPCPPEDLLNAVRECLEPVLQEA